MTSAIHIPEEFYEASIALSAITRHPDLQVRALARFGDLQVRPDITRDYRALYEDDYDLGPPVVVEEIDEQGKPTGRMLLGAPIIAADAGDLPDDVQRLGDARQILLRSERCQRLFGECHCCGGFVQHRVDQKRECPGSLECIAAAGLVIAAGFLVFLAGETLIVSAMNLAASAPLFAAGAGLWAAALGLISAAREFPVLVRATGAIAAVLFAIAAARMFLGARLTALSAPLPFGAYPFLAITLLGWVWAHLRSDRRGTLRRERGTRRSNVRDSAR